MGASGLIDSARGKTQHHARRDDGEAHEVGPLHRAASAQDRSPGRRPRGDDEAFGFPADLVLVYKL